MKLILGLIFGLLLGVLLAALLSAQPLGDGGARPARAPGPRRTPAP
jgi:hypothetical protein